MAECESGNRHLRQARQNAHFTQERNAQELTDLADQMYIAGEISRRTSVSPRQYRRWESSAPPWPHPDHRKLLERFYGKPIVELGFTPPETTGLMLPEAPADLPSGNLDNENEIFVAVNRREALTTGAAALTLAAAGHNLPWLSPAVSAQSGRHKLRVGTEEVDLLRSAVLDLDVIDQRFGGGRLWRSARAHLILVHRLIEEGTYGESIGQELHGIAGQLTTSLGWFCYDAGQQTEARVYFSEALNTAMISGDDPLATRTLSNMARQSVDLGKGREAVRFAHIAQAHAAEWSAPPRVGALLAIREAHGYARLGDKISCGEAIKRAWDDFERGPSARDPDWTSFLNEAELSCLEGMCRLDLGQHGHSAELLGHAARLQDIEYSRNRGMSLAQLAHATLRGHDLDHTVKALGESLQLVDSGMSSPRTMKQLALVRDGLTPHLSSTPVRDVAERLDQYVV